MIRYAGDGKWSSEEDWWIVREMKRFNEQYQAACREHDPDFPQKMSRRDWGSWVEWARPAHDGPATPSWLGRDDIPKVTSIRDMTFGERN